MVGLHGNHTQICKFQGPNDPDYKAVFGALQDYVLGAIQAPGEDTATQATESPRPGFPAAVKTEPTASLV